MAQSLSHEQQLHFDFNGPVEPAPSEIRIIDTRPLLPDAYVPFADAPSSKPTGPTPEQLETIDDLIDNKNYSPRMARMAVLGVPVASSDEKVQEVPVPETVSHQQQPSKPKRTPGRNLDGSTDRRFLSPREKRMADEAPEHIRNQYRG